jgi:hypothetical protein
MKQKHDNSNEELEDYVGVIQYILEINFNKSKKVFP